MNMFFATDFACQKENVFENLHALLNEEIQLKCKFTNARYDYIF